MTGSSREAEGGRGNKGGGMGRGFYESDIRSDRSSRSEMKDRCDRAEKGIGYDERGENWNWEEASTSNDFRSKKRRGSESVSEVAAGIRDDIPEGDLRLKISKRKRDGRDQKTSHRDLRHRIKKKGGYN